jgi:tetratricopeptide (TPR) repeat protein
VRAAGGRGGSAGFNTEVLWSDYALTQCAAVARYLRLAFAPRALVFDYGNSVITSAAAIVPAALLLAALLAATLVALRRARALGFLGASFFLLLAPSSSILPVATQTIAEHRMYLPLAAIAVLVALGLHVCLRRHALAAACVLAAVLGGLTLRRNLDYRSELALWASCAANYPANPRAHFNHGRALTAAGRVPDAIAAFEHALALHTALVKSLALQADALLREGRLTRAIFGREAADWQQRRAAVLHLHLANALALAGRDTEALAHGDVAFQLDPAAGQSATECAAILRLRANAASLPPAGAPPPSTPR